MKEYGYKRGDFPCAEEAASNIFALPMHPYLEKETIRRIAKSIARAVGQ